MKKVFIIIGLVLLGLIVAIFCYFFVGRAKPAEKIDFGVTFSKIQSGELSLNWKEVYLAILDDLNIKRIRLIAYWQEVEPIEGNFDFEDLDWQIEEAEKRGIEIILAVGRRLPRWPECHVPDWAENLLEKEQQEKVLVVISEVIRHYKDSEAIKFWQIENEPFLRTFGECPKLDKKFLEKEIALVRKLDSTRKIILTESGEFSTWIGAARRGDILGTTLYRKVYGALGYVRYPIPAIFYQRKTALIKKFFDIDKVIVIELQAEPWGPDQNWKISLDEQFKSMNPDEFRKIIDYTKRAGFSEAYLWGAEWWYWLKEKHGDNSMWEDAKKLF
jgi:hypothetical protein